MTRRTVVWLAFLSACTVAMIWFLRSQPRVIAESKRSKTLWELQAVYSALCNFGEDKPPQFRQIVTIGQHAVQGHLALEIDEYIRARGEIAPSRLGDAETNEVRDLWGHAFRFLVSEINERTNAAARTGKQYRVSFYSVGPNGKDDQRQGDDVSDVSREIFVPDE